MPEIKLSGDIALVGFEILDPAEIIVVKKIVGNALKRMTESGEYKEMKLTLQQHPHGKSFKHEIEAVAFFSYGRFSTNVIGRNLFTAVSEACEKIISEMEHARKKGQGHDKKTYNR